MVTLRKLCYDDMRQVIELKILCWPEELAGLSNKQLDYDKEFSFWTTWTNCADENDDIRLLYGAFHGDELLGVAIGSFIDSKNSPEKGFELNGLWVFPQHRKKGISLRLLKKLLNDFHELGASKILIYNYHYSPANNFYRKFGCLVSDIEYQKEDNVQVDIFVGNIVNVLNKINESLKNYF